MTPRQYARQVGYTFYTDSRGCRNGHVPTQRYTSTGNCKACSKANKVGPPVRVLVPPHMMATFEALINAMGLHIVSNAQPDPSYENHQEDYSDKIPT